MITIPLILSCNLSIFYQIVKHVFSHFLQLSVLATNPIQHQQRHLLRSFLTYNYKYHRIIWFRFRDTANAFDASSKRYVITNPPTDFNLLPSDQVNYRHRVSFYWRFLIQGWGQGQGQVQGQGQGQGQGQSEVLSKYFQE